MPRRDVISENITPYNITAAKYTRATPLVSCTHTLCYSPVLLGGAEDSMGDERINEHECSLFGSYARMDAGFYQHEYWNKLDMWNTL